MATVAVLICAHLPIAQAQDISINTAQECDSNAVLRCGAGSVTQVVGKYRGGDGRNSAASIHDIYSFFGISSSDITAMNTSAVKVEAGSVSKAGNVFDGSGNIIATDAMTGGRGPIPGSTRVSSGGTPFFTRPPSVSFRSNRLSAFVVMMNGRFAFAILASCGNPIKATPKTSAPAPVPPPKPAPVPTPTPTPPPPATTSVSVCSGNTTNTATATNSGVAQGGNCSTNIVNNTVTTGSTPTCDSLGLSQSANRTVTINSLMTTANGTTFTNVDINWGDGTAQTGVTNPIGQTHQFNSDGSFTISVQPHFLMNGQSVTATGPACQQQVSFNTPTPTVPPPTPTTTVTTTSSTPTAPAPQTTLVNTGAGDVFGLFGAATTVGALSYRLLLVRRLNRV